MESCDIADKVVEYCIKIGFCRKEKIFRYSFSVSKIPKKYTIS